MTSTTLVFPGQLGKRVLTWYRNVSIRDYVGARMTVIVMTTGTIRRIKIQSYCHRHRTKTQPFTGWMPFLLHNQQCQSTEGK